MSIATLIYDDDDNVIGKSGGKKTKYDRGTSKAKLGAPAQITQISRRVIKALPDWNEWPRRLRRIYVLLDTFGSSESSVVEICSEFGWDHEETLGMIDGSKTFTLALQDYRLTGAYPKLTHWTNELRSSELQALYAYEAAIVQFMHLEDKRGQGSFGVKVVEQTGLITSSGQTSSSAGNDTSEDYGGTIDNSEVDAAANALPDWSDFDKTHRTC